MTAVDEAKRKAITACGTCGQPEDAHQHRTGTDAEDIGILFALGGPCPKFTASDASVITQKYLAITSHRAPQRQPGTGRIGKRLPLHDACGYRHHPGKCPIQPDTAAPGSDTASKGAARAREALGLNTATPEET